MADIFLSYSKADREQIAMLAAYLESEGWSVWWDKNLHTGEPFRDEIMKQLRMARAVIVLWTPASVISDFVRAEAGRAKADGKLIPVKNASVAYDDIPLPFGEMHTESLSRQDLIRAAVKAQLVKPQVQPNALFIEMAALRYRLFTWVGIVGGVITLFTNLRGILVLADWAHLLIDIWQKWTNAFWGFLLSWIRFEWPREVYPLLSLMTFTISISIGTVLSERRKYGKTYGIDDDEGPPWTELGVWTTIVATTAILVSYVRPRWDLLIQLSAFEELSFMAALLLLISFSVGSLIYVTGFVPKRAYRNSSALLYFALSIIIVLRSLMMMQKGSRVAQDLFFFVLAFQVPVIVAVVSLNPPVAFFRRLVTLAIGLAILIGLNEISRYGPFMKRWLGTALLGGNVA